VRVSARIPLWLFGIDHGEITVIRRSLKLGQGCCADDTQATPGNANCSGKNERPKSAGARLSCLPPKNSCAAGSGEHAAQEHRIRVVFGSIAFHDLRTNRPKIIVI
jgi:hypothetical protein